jgi:hypothetical protein
VVQRNGYYEQKDRLPDWSNTPKLKSKRKIQARVKCCKCEGDWIRAFEGKKRQPNNMKCTCGHIVSLCNEYTCRKAIGYQEDEDGCFYLLQTFHGRDGRWMKDHGQLVGGKPVKAPLDKVVARSAQAPEQRPLAPGQQIQPPAAAPAVAAPAGQAAPVAPAAHAAPAPSVGYGDYRYGVPPDAHAVSAGYGEHSYEQNQPNPTYAARQYTQEPGGLKRRSSPTASQLYEEQPAQSRQRREDYAPTSDVYGQTGQGQDYHPPQTQPAARGYMQPTAQRRGTGFEAPTLPGMDYVRGERSGTSTTYNPTSGY